jgi:hypothetical protein
MDFLTYTINSYDIQTRRETFLLNVVQKLQSPATLIRNKTWFK